MTDSRSKAQSPLSTKRALELAEETARADGNFASYERIKDQYSEIVLERNRLWDALYKIAALTRYSPATGIHQLAADALDSTMPKGEVNVTDSSTVATKVDLYELRQRDRTVRPRFTWDEIDALLSEIERMNGIVDKYVPLLSTFWRYKAEAELAGIHQQITDLKGKST